MAELSLGPWGRIYCANYINRKHKDIAGIGTSEIMWQPCRVNVTEEIYESLQLHVIYVTAAQHE